MKLVVTILGACLLVACGGGMGRKVEYVADNNVSLVYLHINMDDADSDAEEAFLEILEGPGAGNGYWMRADDNTLYIEGVPNGKYVVSVLTSGGGWYFFSDPTRYNIGVQGNPIRIEITEPGVHYMGSFKYVRESSGLFAPGKFSFTRLKQDQLEVLAKVRENTPEPSWQRKLEKHKAALLAQKK